MSFSASGFVHTLVHDIRFGARVFRKKPGFTGVAILALALGIGANTTIFSVVNTVLLRPFDFHQPDRLVVVWEKNPTRSLYRNFASPANFLEWRDNAHAFAQLAGIRYMLCNLTGDREPEELQGEAVSSSLFPLLGVRPFLGRIFYPDEDQAGRDDVVILSYRLWQRHFGKNPAVIGRPVVLNGHARTVVGIMPPKFQVTNQLSDLWVPLALQPGDPLNMGRSLVVIGRLKPGVTFRQASVEMVSLSRRLTVTYPQLNAGWSADPISLRDELVGNYRQALWVLFGAVGFLLLIACANIANMLLSRAASRRKEIAIRLALGAGRARIARQLLTEGVLLALMGGTMGLFLAMGGIRLVAALGPKEVPRLAQVSLDFRVLGFTLLASVAAGIIFGLAPGIQLLRPRLNETLKEGGRSCRTDRGSRRLRGALVVSEVALAVILLIGAGLMIRSFVGLLSVNPGLNPRNLLTLRILLPGTRKESRKRAVFVEGAIQRVKSLPGVLSVSAVNVLPLTGFGGGATFQVEGYPALRAGQKPVALVRAIDPAYFETIGIPLFRGRDFTEYDTPDSPRVAIVSETLVRRFWPDRKRNPLGSRLNMDFREPVTAQIVGIVGDVRAEGMDSQPWPTIYVPHTQMADPSMTLVLRTAADPARMAPAVIRRITQLAPEQPVADVRTMEQVIADSVARQRFNTLLLTIFAAAALALAAVGIYGVMSYNVSERTQEFGIRMALGAQAEDVMKMVIAQAAKLALAGITIGLVAAFGLTRLMAGLLYGVKPTDVATFAGISMLLALIALVASLVPARSATRVDPVVALHEE